MARAVVIGGSGHIGTYLVPALVEAGYEVVNVSRGQRRAYRPHRAWDQVKTVVMDREALERSAGFGEAIAGLKADTVVDMICFRLDSARQLVGALSGRVRHFVHIGTIWVHGPSTVVPTPETAARAPIGEYGTQKAAIEAFLMEEARRSGFPATIAHPGHIVGPGWALVNPAGNANPAVFSRLARGEELALPNFGQETVHHVHAEDCAQMVMLALGNWSAAAGEAFHTVSPAAVSLRGYAEHMAAWFGRKANLAYLPFEEWKTGQTAEDAQATWEHIYRSPSCSIAKAERLLGYRPRYSSFAAAEEAVAWLIANGQVATV